MDIPKNKDRTARVWFNAPCVTQPYHVYHGRVGIAVFKEDGDCTVYFTEGPVYSVFVCKKLTIYLALKM